VIDKAERRIVRNTVAQAVAPAMRAVLGIFLTIAVSRYLGITKFGEYALAFAYVALITGIFANWGLTTVTVREITRHPQEREIYITSAATLQFVIAVLSYLIMGIGLLVLHHPATTSYAIMIYGLTVFLTPLDILTLRFQAELRLHRTMPPTVIGVLLNFLFTIAVVALHGPLTGLIAASVASLVVQYVWVLLLARPLPLKRPRPFHYHWGMLAREAWPIGAGTTISGFMQQIRKG
jgi:O-antigen/teichoic acid export membrane protein